MSEIDVWKGRYKKLQKTVKTKNWLKIAKEISDTSSTEDNSDKKGSELGDKSDKFRAIEVSSFDTTEIS